MSAMLDASSTCKSNMQHGRTDGRTYEEDGSVAVNLNAPNARARNDINTFNEALLQTLDYWAAGDGERWPVVRTGDRAPIRWGVRLAILRRDKYSCKLCGAGIDDEAQFELDHIVPWSAGGSDRSSNLRVLCTFCNQRRSNFADGTERMTVLPVTWWCIHCWLDGQLERDHWCNDRDRTCPYTVPVFGTVARIVWDDADQYAYCAHCRHPSWTEITL